MDRAPESTVSELLRWIGYELDAAWAAKLAVLRAHRPAVIAHLGACVREHERHAAEMGRLLRALDRTAQVPAEPSFSTRDAFVVGALDERSDVLGAWRGLEHDRVVRYEQRRCVDPVLDALLERHLGEARARLDAAVRLGSVTTPLARAAA